MRKPIFSLILFVFLATACAPVIKPDIEAPSLPSPEAPVANPSGGDNQAANTAPYNPQPGDDRLSRSKAFVSSVELLAMESYPVQIRINLKGSLPTPCHQLRIEAAPPDNQNRILMEVYSVVDPNMVCIQMLEEFEASLNLGSFPSGHYTVWVNGEPAGEFNG